MSDILIADIGGTIQSGRLRGAAVSGRTISSPLSMTVERTGGLAGTHARRRRGAPRAASAALAAPIGGDEITLTNPPDWLATLPTLRQALRYSSVHAVNDFEALRRHQVPSLAMTGSAADRRSEIVSAWCETGRRSRHWARHCGAGAGSRWLSGNRAAKAVIVRSARPSPTRSRSFAGSPKKTVLRLNGSCRVRVSNAHACRDASRHDEAEMRDDRDAGACRKSRSARRSRCSCGCSAVSPATWLWLKATGRLYRRFGVATGLGALFDARLFRAPRSSVIRRTRRC